MTNSSTGLDGGTTDGWVSSTSWIRSPLTAARGAITATNVDIMTAMRISVKYVRNAIS